MRKVFITRAFKIKTVRHGWFLTPRASRFVEFHVRAGFHPVPTLLFFFCVVAKASEEVVQRPYSHEGVGLAEFHFEAKRSHVRGTR